jgi:hypothetical protein
LNTASILQDFHHRPKNLACFKLGKNLVLAMQIFISPTFGVPNEYW